MKTSPCSIFTTRWPTQIRPNPSQHPLNRFLRPVKVYPSTGDDNASRLTAYSEISHISSQSAPRKQMFPVSKQEPGTRQTARGRTSHSVFHRRWNMLRSEASLGSVGNKTPPLSFHPLSSTAKNPIERNRKQSHLSGILLAFPKWYLRGLVVLRNCHSQIQEKMTEIK